MGQRYLDPGLRGLHLGFLIVFAFRRKGFEPIVNYLPVIPHIADDKGAEGRITKKQGELRQGKALILDKGINSIL